MSVHTLLVRCEACQGTGLYAGMGERDGFAVVCRKCKGSGQMLIHYLPFRGREARPGTLRVIEFNPGVVVGGRDRERFGGILYEDWNKGGAFPAGSEMREFSCPAWWYQSVDCKRKPEWSGCLSIMGREFRYCATFPDKAQCWLRWDAEQRAKP